MRTTWTILVLAAVLYCDGSTVVAQEHWAYRPIARPRVAGQVHPVDYFIENKLREQGLGPAGHAGPADRAGRAAEVDLVRRLYIDLLGLPPSPAELDAYLSQGSADRVDALIEQLLGDRRYAERWARHWLDVVRYAESDGYKSDVYRPEAWRYRDYVIDAFHTDKPFDRFVEEQLAGDEMYPADPQALIATGYYRAGPYEDNQSDVEAQWNLVLTEITDTTAEVFLGMSMGCARCHDHKFDPITQGEYFRLRAFFEPLQFDDDLKLATPAALAEYEHKQAQWATATADLRKQIAEIDAPYLERKRRESEARYPKSLRRILEKGESERTPWEAQLFHFAQIQTIYRSRDFQGLIPKEKLAARKELEKQMRREFDALKPEPLPGVLGIRDRGATAPKTRLGDTEHFVSPGTPAVLGAMDLQIAGGEHTTGRRSALARWITDAANPLPARVLVNRIWRAHFGRGLVDTPNDLGRLGSVPSHAELLDYLASELIDSGWSVKHVQRLILTSATYQQSGRHRTTEAAAKIDPDNRLLWRFPMRRMEGDVIRDSMLRISGELDMQAGGPSADHKSNRRSIYLQHLRNRHHDLLSAFDCPINFDSTPDRPTTTTAPQALLLLNNDWVLARAEAFAQRLEKEHPGQSAKKIIAAYRYAFGRVPAETEVEGAIAFLQRQASAVAAEGEADREGEEGVARDAMAAAWVDFCHALLNANEFLYVN